MRTFHNSTRTCSISRHPATEWPGYRSNGYRRGSSTWTSATRPVRGRRTPTFQDRKAAEEKGRPGEWCCTKTMADAKADFTDALKRLLRVDTRELAEEERKYQEEREAEKKRRAG